MGGTIGGNIRKVRGRVEVRSVRTTADNALLGAWVQASALASGALCGHHNTACCADSRDDGLDSTLSYDLRTPARPPLHTRAPTPLRMHGTSLGCDELTRNYLRPRPALPAHGRVPHRTSWALRATARWARRAARCVPSAYTYTVCSCVRAYRCAAATSGSGPCASGTCTPFPLRWPWALLTTERTTVCAPRAVLSTALITLAPPRAMLSTAPHHP